MIFVVSWTNIPWSNLNRSSKSLTQINNGIIEVFLNRSLHIEVGLGWSTILNKIGLSKEIINHYFCH